MKRAADANPRNERRKESAETGRVVARELIDRLDKHLAVTRLKLPPFRPTGLALETTCVYERKSILNVVENVIDKLLHFYAVTNCIFDEFEKGLSVNSARMRIELEFPFKSIDSDPRDSTNAS